VENTAAMPTLTFLQSMKFTAKLLLIIAIGMIGLGILSVVSLYSYKNNLVSEKKQELKHVVETATSAVDFYYQLAKEGKLSEEAARQSAMAVVGAMRYEGTEYFWINDLHNIMLMHPYKPELVGKELSDLKDAHGKKFFAEFMETAKTHGAGYVFYAETRHQSDR
jgi:methyl-accepting chemotaxis protein